MDSTLFSRPEEELLLCCARSKMNSKTLERTKYLIKMDLDWEYLLKLATRHKMKPILYWQLNKMVFEDIPDKILIDLKDDFKLNAQKNLMMLSELLRIINIFNSEGIISRPYKGPVLAIIAYDDISLRKFNDLDIFVPPELIKKVEDLMLSLEYKKVLDLKTPEQIEAFMKFQREFKFYNDNGIIVEIKWRFPVSSFSFPADPICLFNEKELLYNNLSIKTISAENLLLVLCLHNAGHYWSRLNMICDISELINSKRNLDWESIFSLAKKLSIERILFVNLFLAHNLFDLQLPEDILRNIKNDDRFVKISMKIIERLFSNDEKDLTLFQKIIIRIHIRENFNNKIRDFVNLIFIPTPGVLEKNSFPTVLNFLYYIMRILQLIRIYLLRSYNDRFL